MPVRGGIALSLKMNRIREVSEDDFVAVVQPGVITAALQNAVEASDLLSPRPGEPFGLQHRRKHRHECRWAALPEVRGDTRLCARVGGGVADGSIAKLGGRCHKNKTGFDLARFVGSEGLNRYRGHAEAAKPPFRRVSAGFRSSDAAGAVRESSKPVFCRPRWKVPMPLRWRLPASNDGRQFDGCNAHLIVEIDAEKSTRSELRELQNLIGEFSPLFIQKDLGKSPSRMALRREFSIIAGHRPDKTQQRHRRASGMLQPLFELLLNCKTRYPRGLFRPCGRREHSRQPDDGRGRPGTGQAK